MNKELIINAGPTGVEIALLEDKKLVELHSESADMNFAVGDLYLGKVKKLIPGLNAAFIDVGYEKDAFLHYTDLSPYARSIIKYTQMAIHDKEPNGFDFSKFQTEPEIIKTGKINEVLNGKPNVLVQILKEPIAAKGPRLSCEISLPGRFVVVTPFNEIVAVSKKIHSGEERKRLHKIVEAIRPKNFGIIVRTAAEGKSTAELHQDLLGIIEKAIQTANIGVNPNNNGEVIKLFFPPMTVEQRQETAKQAKVMTDNAKVAIRNIRQNSNTKIKNLLKDKLITEDDSKKAQDEVQKITDGFVAKADETLKTKEKEILTV